MPFEIEPGTKRLDPRGFIQKWHENDPHYNSIVNGIPLNTGYSYDFDRRMEQVLSGFPGLEEQFQHVVSSIIGDKAGLQKVDKMLKRFMAGIESSLADSVKWYKKIYMSRGVDKLKDMSRVLDAIIVSHFPDKKDMKMALKLKMNIEKGLKSVHAAKKFRTTKFNIMLKSYGSRASFLHGQNSDIDLAILGTFAESGNADIEPIFAMGRKKRDVILHVLASYLSVHGYKVQKILRTRVPLIKVLDKKSGLESDVCISNDVENYPKSELLLCLNLADPRFRMLTMLVKAWAKHNQIHDASLGRFNSYSLVSLVIFHLQTRPKPILPRLKDLLPPRGHSKGKVNCTSHENVIRGMVKGVASWKEQADINDESILELFVSFLLLMRGLFSSRQDSKQHQEDGGSHEHRLILRCMRISTYHGSLHFNNTSKDLLSRWMSKSQLHTQQGVLFIEDPFDTKDNSARALSNKCFNAMLRVVERSLDSFINDSIDVWELKAFGYRPWSKIEASPTMEVSVTPKIINPWAALGANINDSDTRHQEVDHTEPKKRDKGSKKNTGLRKSKKKAQKQPSVEEGSLCAEISKLSLDKGTAPKCTQTENAEREAGKKSFDRVVETVEAKPKKKKSKKKKTKSSALPSGTANPTESKTEASAAKEAPRGSTVSKSSKGKSFDRVVETVEAKPKKKKKSKKKPQPEEGEASAPPASRKPSTKKKPKKSARTSGVDDTA